MVVTSRRAGAAARVFGAPARYGVDLTPREAQVLALIGEGADNAEIATRLGVSEPPDPQGVADPVGADAAH
jgi:DNA-binding CsgD family transcriptional regulator